MKLVSAVIKPFKLDEVKVAVREVGVTGMTVSQVRGFGRTGGHIEIYRGKEYEFDFVDKLKVEIVTTDEMVERTLEEMKALDPALTADQLQRHARMLRNAFPPVKAGDRITAIHTPGQPVRFFHNGRMTASSEDSSFAAPFFGIWLSPKTSEPSLRRALLRLPG
jgi:nitrogen regulatory protein PII